MYNVLEKLRGIECRGVLPYAQGAQQCVPTITLSAKERLIHEQGLVSVLKQIHDDLDRAVADAYGWPADLPDEELLARLVALNAERAREEANGLVRWLRPEYQNPQGAPHPASGHPLPEGEGQGLLPLPEGEGRGEGERAKLPWPKTLPEQVAAVRAALANAGGPATAETIARTFQRARVDKVAELLVTLATLGQVREVARGEYVA